MNWIKITMRICIPKIKKRKKITIEMFNTVLSAILVKVDFHDLRSGPDRSVKLYLLL